MQKLFCNTIGEEKEIRERNLFMIKMKLVHIRYCFLFNELKRTMCSSFTDFLAFFHESSYTYVPYKKSDQIISFHLKTISNNFLVNALTTTEIILLIISFVRSISRVDCNITRKKLCCFKRWKYFVHLFNIHGIQVVDYYFMLFDSILSPLIGECIIQRQKFVNLLLMVVWASKWYHYLLLRLLMHAQGRAGDSSPLQCVCAYTSAVQHYTTLHAQSYGQYTYTNLNLIFIEISQSEFTFLHLMKWIEWRSHTLIQFLV